jgi:hypothetical protein
MKRSITVIAAALMALGAGYVAADTTDKSAAAKEQGASPANPTKQEEERTQAHSQPEVPHASGGAQGAIAAPATGDAGGGNASEGASRPAAALPSTRQANRANNANYYQSGEFNEIHPEEAYPDNLPRLTAEGDHSELIRQVQRRLRERGFDAGPVNGDFGAKTQAALAQFQLAQNLPVSGGLDSPTLDALGVVAGLAPGAASNEPASGAVNPPSRPSP